LAAHSAYGTGGLLGWLVDHGIDPHIPVWDKSEAPMERSRARTSPMTLSATVTSVPRVSP